MKKLIARGVLLVGLIASNLAQAADLTWTNSDGLFSDGANSDAGTAPVSGDITHFTNDTSYTVSFSADSPSLVTNIFAGHAGTVTVDPGAFTWILAGGMKIGDQASTATVYLASGTIRVSNFGVAQLRIADGTNAVAKAVVTNGTVLADNVSVGASAFSSGTLVISDSGVLTNGTFSGTITVGNGASGSQLIVTNGGKVFVVGETRIGHTGTSNNLVLVSGSSSIMSNKSFGIRVGAGGARGNLLIVTNGAKVFMNAGTIGGNGQGTAFNTGIVVGASSVYESDGNVSLAPSPGGGTNNNLTVYDGATFICGGSLTIGNASDFPVSNSVNMGGTGLMCTGSAAVVRFGSSTLLERLILTNVLFSSGTVSLQGVSNTISVLADSTWIMTTNLTTSGSAIGAIITIDGGSVSNEAGVLIGQGTSSGSQLIITNGGKLVSNYGSIGAGAAFCTGIVAGAGSVWSNTGPDIMVGTGVGGSNNYLAVLSGASLFNSGSLNIGNSLTANGNSVFIGGIGAPSTVVNDGSLNVGGSAGSYSNRLTVTNAVLNCGVLNVGVTDSTNNTLAFKGGTIVVGYIRVRPTNTVLFTPGTLSTGDTTVDAGANNNRPTVVGDGTSAAFLELAAGGSGLHDFNAGGLVITNNATLRGEGTLLGNVTVLGTWSPGFFAGTITTSNNLTFGSNAVIDYDLGTSSDFTEVDGNLALSGTLNITGAGGFGVGAYVLFTYTGTLSGNGLTIGTTPDSGLDYAIDTNTPAQVKLNVTTPPPPVASFTGNPTSGALPLAVIFTDSSSGTITNRFWDFGDGDTTNTTETSLSHTYIAAASYTVSLTVDGRGGSDTNTQSSYIAAQNPPQLVVNPGSLSYGSVTIGQSNSLDFTVINPGDMSLIGTATTVAPFEITSGGSYNVAAGQTQTVTVAFTPSSAGSFNESVTFASNGGNLTNTVSGTGLTPGSISVTPTAYDFGGVLTGATAQVGFVVTNSGGTVVSNGTATASGPFTVVSNATFSVPAFGTTNVVVEFAPIVEGAFTNDLVFATDNGGNVTNRVTGMGGIVAMAAFSGTPTDGTAPLAVTFTNASSGSITNSFWDFGDGTTTNTMAATVDHTYEFAGTNTVSLTVFGTVGTDTQTLSDYIVATNPPPPVAAFSGTPTNGATPLAVTFTNASSGSITNSFWNFGDGNTSNTMAATLIHTYDNTGTNTVSLTVSGLGGSDASTQSDYIVVVNPAHLVVNPGSLSFGSLTIGQSNSLSFSVVNTGDLLLSGTAASTAPFEVTSGGAYNNLTSGQTQTVIVTFLPGSAGSFNGSVTFASDGGNSTNTVSGTGLTPGNIVVTPATLDFGALATGTTAQASFLVTNSGGTAVSNGTATALGGPFTIVSGATFSVPGLGTTNVTVQFAPPGVGAFTNRVAFTTGNGGDATNAVIGVGAIPPVAGFTGTPINGQTPLAVTFTDGSSGTITNRFWNFGDGNTTNTGATSVNHTYNAAGTNTVSLTVFGLGGSSTTNRPNYIIVTNFVADVTPPQLQIVSPTDYEEFTNANITVSGVASDANGINGVTVGGSAASIAGTNWSQSVTLSLGTNSFTVIATDASANLNTATQTVHAVLLPNHPPQIASGLSVTNALLNVDNTSVVEAYTTNIFAVSATDVDGNLLNYQWVFGDGNSSNSFVNIAGHVYTNECGPYNVSVTVSDGQVSTNSDRTVIVACQMQITKLLAKVNFAKTNVDTCSLTATNIVLPDGFALSNKTVTLDVGGTNVSFATNSKGRWVKNNQGTCKLSLNKKTNTWTMKVNLKKTNFQSAWVDEGFVNANVPKPGATVTLTVAVLVDGEAFAADRTMLYRAAAGKSGSAK